MENKELKKYNESLVFSREGEKITNEKQKVFSMSEG